MLRYCRFRLWRSVRSLSRPARHGAGAGRRGALRPVECDSSFTLFLAAPRSCVSADAVFGFHAPWTGTPQGGYVDPRMTAVFCAGLQAGAAAGVSRPCARHGPHDARPVDAPHRIAACESGLPALRLRAAPLHDQRGAAGHAGRALAGGRKALTLVKADGPRIVGVDIEPDALRRAVRAAPSGGAPAPLPMWPRATQI